MSERKVLNKYYPPDFDPSKIPRRKQPKDKQDVIRLMAPFSMRCKTCGHYIGVGKKFNGRKETVQNETYLGLRIFRLYFKCPMCSSEITIKTDPRNSDYTVEHGVTRNFEPWRENKEQDKVADPLAHIIAEEGLDASDDDEDPMKALEARQEESRREMEVMDALQDMQNRNARLDRVDTADVLGRVEVKGKAKLTAEELEQKRLEEEDEKLVQRYFGRDLAGPSAAGPKFASDSPASHSPETPGSADAQPAASTAGMTIKRLQAYDDEDDETASKAARVANREPDIHAVLSERAREQLLSATAKVGASATASKSHPVVSSSAPKRKKQASAFGIVRKKA